VSWLSIIIITVSTVLLLVGLLVLFLLKQQPKKRITPDKGYNHAQASELGVSTIEATWKSIQN
jgi:hypothetical protein